MKKTRGIRKVLLVNPPSWVAIYNTSRISAAVPKLPAQSIGVLSAVLIEEGFSVKPLDLLLSKSPYNDLETVIREFKPDAIGVSFTTPLFGEALKIAEIAREIDPGCMLIAGGVHPTALPQDTLLNSMFDVAVIGEGEITLPELLRADNRAKVNGIAFRDGEKVIITEPRAFIEDLDTIPLPAWHLFDVKKYTASRITSRRNPIGGILTGRGCAYPCTFCNKSVFGKKYRKKSPGRVIEEIKHILDCGFREIHFLDDLFTMNMDYAKEVCRLIISEGLDFTWNLFSGLRVDTVDRELLLLLKDAGCFTVSYGVESGNEELLKAIGKKYTLEDCRRAFSLTEDVGLESVGFFMFGLPGETVETMDKTIEFAIELNPTYAKATTLLPFPSTPLFAELEAEGRIKSKDWNLYNFHCSRDVWEHPNLSWDQLRHYYNLFYRRFYLRPAYVARRLKRGILKGEPFYDAYYAIRNFLG